MSEKRACGNCHLFVAGPKPSPAGVCLWVAPPYIKRMVEMLKAEPATRIDWVAACEQPPATTAYDYCSEWRAPESHP